MEGVWRGGAPWRVTWLHTGSPSRLAVCGRGLTGLSRGRGAWFDVGSAPAEADGEPATLLGGHLLVSASVTRGRGPSPGTGRTRRSISAKVKRCRPCTGAAPRDPGKFQ